jgi:hypothetical protein
VLAFYGQGLPDFIAGFRPAAVLPWLADMARLEMARVVACHAADADPVAAAALGQALAHGERIAELRLACHPSVATLQSAHAVVSLWAAHQGDGAIGAIDIDTPEAAIVLRCGLDVLVLPAPAGAVAFVQAVQVGQALGDAAGAASAAAPQFDLTATLSLLLAHGALTSLSLPTRPAP